MSNSVASKKKHRRTDPPCKDVDMAWNPLGDTLVMGGSHINISNFGSTGLAAPRTICHSEREIKVVKFFDENIFGTLTDEFLDIWDLRYNCSLAVNSLKTANFNRSKFITFDWNCPNFIASTLD